MQASCVIVPLLTFYSRVQWNWFSDISGCTWISYIRWCQRTNFTAPGCRCNLCVCTCSLQDGVLILYERSKGKGESLAGLQFGLWLFSCWVCLVMSRSCFCLIRWLGCQMIFSVVVISTVNDSLLFFFSFLFFFKRKFKSEFVLCSLDGRLGRFAEEPSAVCGCPFFDFVIFYFCCFMFLLFFCCIFCSFCPVV